MADDSAAERISKLQFQYKLGRRFLYAEKDGRALFTDNENNAVRLYGCSSNPKPYVKDGFHRHVIHGEASVNPAHTGTKSCIWYQKSLGAGESWVLRLRMTPQQLRDPLATVDETIRTRSAEADEFYETVYAP